MSRPVRKMRVSIGVGACEIDAYRLVLSVSMLDDGSLYRRELLVPAVIWILSKTVYTATPVPPLRLHLPTEYTTQFTGRYLCVTAIASASASACTGDGF